VSGDDTILEAIRRGKPISAKRAADLLARLAIADELADAVEHFHEMSRLAEIDPSRKLDLAAASYRLGAALGAYRMAQKANSDGL
jgi:hypothetical protein